MNKFKSFKLSFISILIAVAMVISIGLSPVSSYAQTSKATISVNDSTITMTQEKSFEVTADLGTLIKDASKVKIYFGDKELSEWRTQKDRDGNDEPFFTVTESTVVDGSIIKVKFNTARYTKGNFSDFLNVRGEYPLKIVDESSKAEASTPIMFDMYESYNSYDELLPTLEDIQKNARDNIYMDIQSIGKSNNGRDLNFVILANNKESVDKYLQSLPEALDYPSKVIEKVKNNTIGDYKVAVFINNIHPNELPGVDSQINLLKKLTTEENITYKTKEINSDGFAINDEITETFNVDDVLSNVILLFDITQNPDGRFLNTRGNSFGVDLNRDNLYQTQTETNILPQTIAKWNPVAFLDLHGFGGYLTNFLIDPCSPPHNPNYEYDLIAYHSTQLAAKFAETGIANTDYDEYEIPLRDYLGANLARPGIWDPMFDDMSPVYTPSYAMLHGSIAQTVEMPEPNEESTSMVTHGMLGYIKLVSDTKEELYINQLEYFKRGVEGIELPETETWFVDQNNQPYGEKARVKNVNGKFFPEYFVIPVDANSQTNIYEAYKMIEYLLDNGIKVNALTKDSKVNGITYKKGSYIVNMYQAKKGFANLVLGNGSNISGWDDLYSEAVANFPALRGFDCQEIFVKDAFKGMESPVTEAPKASTILTGQGKYIIIKNNSNETVRAVNQLIKEGKEVKVITKDNSAFIKGDFVVSNETFSLIKDKYVLMATGSNTEPISSTIKTKPVLFVNGDALEKFAYEEQLGFEITTDISKANMIVGAAKIDDYIQNIKSGTPFIGTGSAALVGLKSNILTSNFDYVTTKTSHESLYKVTYTDSMIASGYADDEIMYGVGGSWITKTPQGSEIIVKIKNSNDFFLEGWHTGYEASKGQILGFEYEKDGLDLTVFANTITRKAHQQDEYRLVANAIYDNCLQ